MKLIGCVIVAGLLGLAVSADALTCTRYGSALASCDDGTMIWDYSSRMRSVDGPGAERGLQGYPVPSGGRADVPEAVIVPSVPPEWYRPLPTRSRDGGCVQVGGGAVCW
jgi:hypothetical protein